MAKAYVINHLGEKVIIAESDKPTRIEGNYYFPPDSVKTEYL